MKCVVVTGSAGFIGFHVSRALLDRNETVVGVDNFNTYYYPGLKRARQEKLARSKNFVSMERDLADLNSVESLFQEFRPQIVCHLAAQAGVRYSLRNPVAYHQSNLAGFVNVIDQARRAEVERFVYASSSSVYGGNTKIPFSEDDRVDRPASLYGATKRANELIAYTYTQLWGMATIGLRLFTVYGPWGRPDMAYWSFLDRIVTGETIQVYNFGKHKRDFTYIDDIAQGVLAALSRPMNNSFELINLGNNRPVELMRFIERIEDLAGRKAVTEMVQVQPGDVLDTYADITKAREMLDFEPSVPFEAGIEKFVRWFMDHPQMIDEVRRFKKIRRQ
ncbi:MAG: NAD-dependent epimerase/dehydratase family protein [Deltaproteobacteria bacterium]|nr:NAD-dependent epimerase/dehydratase family protein [Deltaproteobacteria bacterium]